MEQHLEKLNSEISIGNKIIQKISEYSDANGMFLGKIGKVPFLHGYSSINSALNLWNPIELINL